MKAREAIADKGFFVIPSPLGAEMAARAPVHFAETVLAERVEMTDHQVIRALPKGRSFASTMIEASLHTDSQMFRDRSPDVQLLLCIRQAKEGGESTLLDGFSLLDRIAKEDPDLYRELFFTPRRIPFVFGDVHGPTAALRRGRLSLAHSPVVAEGDSIASRLLPFLEQTPLIEVRLSPGELLFVDNRRMLHGRRAFSDSSRELCRILCWLARPLPEPKQHRAMAEEAARALGLPIDEPAETLGQARMRIVMEMIRGVPPGVLSAREGIHERELYRMRDAAMAAAERALETNAPPKKETGFAARLFGRLLGTKMG